jgi:hypothetical protein
MNDTSSYGWEKILSHGVKIAKTLEKIEVKYRRLSTQVYGNWKKLTD